KKWRNILWSDETKINMMGSDGRRYVRRSGIVTKVYLPNQELLPKYTIKHGGDNIKLWGAFSWYGVDPIYWIKNTMDQNKYVHILENIMLPFAKEDMPLIWKLKNKNDPKHTSKKAKKFFKDHKVYVIPWPPQSPDLNPIENLSRDLKIAVSKHKVRNQKELWEIIQREWISIPIERCRKLVESMPRRCEAVIKNRDYMTKY
ncbi:Transposable element Tcb1 transposase, partial [Camponotus floridanus]